MVYTLYIVIWMGVLGGTFPILSTFFLLFRELLASLFVRAATPFLVKQKSQQKPCLCFYYSMSGLASVSSGLKNLVPITIPRLKPPKSLNLFQWQL